MGWGARWGWLRRHQLGLYVLVLLLPGCQTLLPQASSNTPFRWSSFEDATAAIQRVVLDHSTRESLHEVGFDPRTNASLTILNHVDLAQRFAVGALQVEDMDPGIRACLMAGRQCSGYAVHVRQTVRKRIGNFWLDVLNFRRESELTGWSFDALIVFVDDLVVYTLSSGQPGIHEFEVVRNPLGPLQGFGDALRPSLIR